MEPRRHPGGRPSKLTPERIKSITDMLRLGVLLETAADAPISNLT